MTTKKVAVMLSIGFLELVVGTDKEKHRNHEKKG